MLFKFCKHFCTNISSTRDKLVKMSLININKYGWNENAIKVASNELGYSNSIASIISTHDLIYYVIDGWNCKLKSEIKELKQDSSLDEDEKVKKALKLRLSYEIPYVNTWSQAIKLGLQPSYLSSTVDRLLTLTDEICSLYEDSQVSKSSESVVSANRNLINKTRRLLILKIFIISEMNLLNDRSYNNKSTYDLVEQLYNVNIALFNSLSKFTMVNSAILSMIKYSLTSLIPYDYSKIDEMLEMKEKLQKEEIDLKL